MSLLRIDASLLPATSASRALGDLVEAEWTAAHPDSVVTHRNLIESPIPADAWQNAVYAGFTPEEDRTEEQRAAVALAAQLADELIEADALLFTVPLYNFGVSQHFKLWFDLAYTDPRTNNTSTTLAGKPATLATVLGGNYGEGTPKGRLGPLDALSHAPAPGRLGPRPPRRAASLHACRREPGPRPVRRPRRRAQGRRRDEGDGVRPRARGAPRQGQRRVVTRRIRSPHRFRDGFRTSRWVATHLQVRKPSRDVYLERVPSSQRRSRRATPSASARGRARQSEAERVSPPRCAPCGDRRSSRTSR